MKDLMFSCSSPSVSVLVVRHQSERITLMQAYVGKCQDSTLMLIGMATQASIQAAVTLPHYTSVVPKVGVLGGVPGGPKLNDS